MGDLDPFLKVIEVKRCLFEDAATFQQFFPFLLVKKDNVGFKIGISIGLQEN